MHKIKILLVVALLAALMSGCATGPKPEEVNRMALIENRLARLSADISILQRASDDNSEALRKVANDLREELNSLRSGNARYLTKLEAIERRISALSERMDDTESRLTSYRSSTRTNNRTGTIYTRPTGMDETTYLQELDGESEEPSKPIVAGSEQELYRMGYEDFLHGDYSQAAAKFRRCLSAYRGGSFNADAQYYLAECLFNQADYTTAVEEYDKLIRDYEDSANLTSAIYKKGLAFLESNQTGQGILQLQQLIRRYPDSMEARLASEKLRSLGIEPL
jgi:tol-pal system protein YbgF